MNDEALKEIRSVNSEIIEDFRHSAYNDPRENFKAATSTYYVPESRPAHAISEFQMGAMRQGQEESAMLRNRLN